jgi:hypothetical protein
MQVYWKGSVRKCNTKIQVKMNNMDKMRWFIEFVYISFKYFHSYFLYIDTCIRCPNTTFDIWLQLYIDSYMQRYDTSLKHLNWMQVYQLANDTILFYDLQVNNIIFLLFTYSVDCCFST